MFMFSNANQRIIGRMRNRAYMLRMQKGMLLRGIKQSVKGEYVCESCKAKVFVCSTEEGEKENAVVCRCMLLQAVNERPNTVPKSIIHSRSRRGRKHGTSTSEQAGM